MTDVLRIEAKVIGRKKPLFDDWSIPIPPQAARDGGRITLRDLITWTVVEEVEAFRQRQAARRLETVLTRIQIWEGAERGKIDSGGSDLQQEVDVNQAIAVALQAFDDGIYFVFVDEQQ